MGATPTEVSGDGALAGGTTIGVFLKAGSAPGEIEEFLTSATAAEDGSWSVTLPQALPMGVSIGVTETAYQGTSEMAIATVTAETGTATGRQRRNHDPTDHHALSSGSPPTPISHLGAGRAHPVGPYWFINPQARQLQDRRRR